MKGDVGWKQRQEEYGCGLEMEEEATSQAMQAPLEAGEGKGMNSSLEPPKGTSPADTFMSAH